MADRLHAHAAGPIGQTAAQCVLLHDKKVGVGASMLLHKMSLIRAVCKVPRLICRHIIHFFADTVG